MLHIHHIVCRSQGGTNAMNNHATVCSNCHSPKSHKSGWKLYDWRPALPAFKGATFMTSVRWILYRRVKEQYPDTEVQLTYGATTKGQCRELDRKKRRNNRILEKIYDEKYIDLREKKKRSEQEPACDRTNRDHTRDTEKLHRYLETKVSSETGIRSNHMIWSSIMDR